MLSQVVQPPLQSVVRQASVTAHGPPVTVLGHPRTSERNSSMVGTVQSLKPQRVSALQTSSGVDPGVSYRWYCGLYGPAAGSVGSLGLTCQSGGAADPSVACHHCESTVQTPLFPQKLELPLTQSAFVIHDVLHPDPETQAYG
jgi:hypothetical protein